MTFTLNPYTMKTTALLLLLLTVFACQSESPENFGDFVDITKIEKVEMRNNSGKFMLNDKQLELFKRELESLTPVTGSYKTGGIGMTLTVKGKEYMIAGNTNGEYVECPIGLITDHKEYFGKQEAAYFRTNGVNFDIFQP